jgi:predicted O-methyltransferase YrrM
LQSESDLHPHVPAECAAAFLAYSTITTEIEVLNWLHATVCLLKPTNVLETGAAEGLGTIALAAACRANGVGHVHSLEIDSGSCSSVRQWLAAEGLARYATVHCMDSREFLERTSLRFDFAFFDSLTELRAVEYGICLRRGLAGQVAVFHDTSPLRAESEAQVTASEVQAAYREQLLQFARNDPDCTGWFESTLSRGLFVLHRRPSHTLA